jgi:hypothetical protein
MATIIARRDRPVLKIRARRWAQARNRKGVIPHQSRKHRILRAHDQVQGVFVWCPPAESDPTPEITCSRRSEHDTPFMAQLRLVTWTGVSPVELCEDSPNLPRFSGK